MSEITMKRAGYQRALGRSGFRACDSSFGIELEYVKGIQLKITMSRDIARRCVVLISKRDQGWNVEG